MVGIIADEHERKEITMKNISIDTIDITGEAPQEEPLRQYYYMAAAKEKIREAAETLGRPLTFCVAISAPPLVLRLMGTPPM